MRFEARLTGEASTLARPHAPTLERLPATFHASILIELEKWTTLFAAERAYQRALLEHLTGLPAAERERLFAAVARVEVEAGCDRIATQGPGRLPGRGAGRPAQAAPADALAAGGRRGLPGDPAGARRPAPSRRRAAPADRPDLRGQHRRPGRSSCGAASAGAACASRWRSTAPAARTRSFARCSAAATRRAPPRCSPASAAPRDRRRSMPGSSNRTRRCTRAPSRSRPTRPARRPPRPRPA